MEKIYDTIIIGGGPAGYSAALYCARNALSTLVVEKLSAGGQMATSPHIENYPGFDEAVDGFDLAEKMQHGAERFGAETLYETVTKLDLSKDIKIVETTGGILKAKTIICAMGAYPRELGLKKENQLRGKGVAYCATCDGMMFKNKDVIVVGGGNSAIADALYLSKICHHVTIIHRRDTLRASRVYEDQLKHSGVGIIWNSKVVDIVEDGNVCGAILEDVHTKETKEIACDGIFVAVGRVADTSLVKDQLKLDAQGYILADETTRTNVDGVFAIGDIRSKPLRQIVTAVSDGATASKFVEEYLIHQQHE